MSILILETGDTRARQLAQGLDGFGVHDWRVGHAVAGETLVLDPGVAAAPVGAVRVDTPERALAAVLATPPPASAVNDGLYAYVARCSHTLNNALTPGILNASMARTSLEMGDLGALSDDLDQVSASLTCLRARLDALTACVARRITPWAPRTVLSFFGRSDSMLRLVHCGERQFALQDAPDTALPAGVLEGWIMTAVEAAGDRMADLRIGLRAGGTGAVVDVARVDGVEVRWSPGLRHLGRAMATMGGQLAVAGQQLSLHLPPATATARVDRPVQLRILCPTLRRETTNRLLFMGSPPITDPAALLIVDPPMFDRIRPDPDRCLVLISRAQPYPPPAEATRVLVDSASPERFAAAVAEA